jgi:hypothetical protein
MSTSKLRLPLKNCVGRDAVFSFFRDQLMGSSAILPQYTIASALAFYHFPTLLPARGARACNFSENYWLERSERSELRDNYYILCCVCCTLY